MFFAVAAKCASFCVVSVFVAVEAADGITTMW